MKYLAMACIVALLSCGNSDQNSTDGAATGTDTLNLATDTMMDNRVDKTEVDPANRDTLRH